ncbi:BA75_00556T0 [Komagataella pastoris]|uniref:BA75_00556T0 n=1 Tax=Komagataella pastoris TaxID=4922 RepID=A0A1B2J7H4_PICPA|nr:BA75_00556T0 [Komagataella pastoris]
MSFILKREGSFNEDDHPSKFKKVTDSFLGFLKKKIGNRSQDEYAQDSFQQDSLLEQQTDILHPDTTSLQELDSVADQSTRPSNVFSSYYDLLKRQKEQSEQTHLHKPLSSVQPKRTNTHPPSQQGEEDLSLLSKRQRDTSSLDLVPPSKKLKSVDSVRTSLVDINPMERALLINLKERMEMDKYFKSRVKYMGFHNRHLKNGGATRSLQNTRSRSPLFLKSVATQNLRSSISQDRKKHGGYFSGEFEYDLDDSTNNYPENQNLLQYKPAVSSLKFSDRPQDKYHPKPPNEADVERIVNGRVTEPVFKQSKPNLLGPQKDSIGPSIGFKFGNNPSSSENELNATAVENSSQSLLSNNKTEEAKPKFSFGNVQEKKDSDASQKVSSNNDFSLSSKKEISKPSSSFTTPSVNGTSAPTELPAKPSLSFVAATTAKPAFSFGAPKIDELKQDDENKQISSAASTGDLKPAIIPTLSLTEASGDANEQQKLTGISFSADSQSSAKEQPKGQLPTFIVSEKTEPKAAFSFGPPATTSQKDGATKSKFSFGSASTGSADKTTDTHPKFSFDAVATTNEKSDAGTPTFSFGSSNGSTSTEKKENAKTSFTFNGSTKQAAEPEAKTSFSLNAPTDQKIESKPVFSFITSSEAKTAQNNPEEGKPAFSFSAPVNKEAPKPAFSFNVSSEKKEQPTTTSFGSQDNKPSSPPKPVFSFASTNAQNEPKDDSQKSFSFGKEGADNNNKRTFGFDETSTASKNSASAFSFNSQSNSSKPAFSLGNEKGESFTAPAVSFNNNTNANNFGFGSVNSNVASAGSSKEPTPSVVNFSSSKGTFGTSTQPSLNSNAFQFGAATGNNPSANRSENNAFTQPQAGFNPSRSATPNFNFTGTSQLDPAAIFGGSGSTPPLPFGQSSVQLNQPQPQVQPNTAFSFGFGNQQQAPSGTPTPSTTPGVKGRVLARMRQRRRN